MGWVRGATVLLFSVLLLALPGEALALKLTPPGKSGTDQYFETIPTSAGNAAPPGGKSGGGNGAVAQLGQGHAGVSRLAHLGKDGQAAASLAAATAPSSASGTGSGKTGKGASPTGGALTPPGDSAPGAIARALTGSDSGGLGLALPLLLVTVLIAAGGLLAWKLRQGSDQPELPV
jgi:hypothetical protein